MSGDEIKSSSSSSSFSYSKMGIEDEDEDEKDFTFETAPALLRHDKPRNLWLKMNVAFEHLAIPSPNPAGLRDWYVRVLGAREIFNNGQTPPTLLIALPGGGWFEIYASDAPLPERGNNKLQGFRHVALRVDSIDTAKAELEKRGVKFEEEIRAAAGGGRVLFFEDGEGNLLHLVERPAGFKL